MFEGFPFLHGASLSYRAFFGGTFLAASLYQLALLAVFRAASRAAQARSARRGRDEAQRAYFECLGETAAARGGDAGGGGGGGEGRSKCARFLRPCRRWLWRSCAPRAALSGVLFLLALMSYFVCVLLAFGHSPWTGRPSPRVHSVSGTIVPA